MWNWTPKDENKPSESFHPEATHIGKSIVIKGEVSGSENVYVDGELNGSVELPEGNLTVGPDGRIRANVQARSSVHVVFWPEDIAKIAVALVEEHSLSCHGSLL